MKKIVLMTIMCMGLTAGCAKQQPVNETIVAQDTLISFFNNLNEGKFTEALDYFTTDEKTWEELDIYNPDKETDHADIIENYCQATLTCLPASIVRSTKVNDNEYNYQIQFRKEDGNIFVLGPCCGATEEEMPPKDTFDFTVKKIDGTFKVITPPLYIP